MARTAIVLFNLGGPDSPGAVRPFLFNLFNDPMILRLPGPLRWPLAQILSRRRAPVARAIYARIGGRSPILDETAAQAKALQAALADGEVQVFVAMRYWHPMAGEVAAAAREWGAERVVLLPLYPQFSSTTTGSFLRVWRRAADEAGLDAPTVAVCCYPAAAGLIAALAALIRPALAEAAEAGAPRLLFSAHGLPKKFVEAGDPYRDHVERTVASVLAALGDDAPDHVVCYQSRVGPLEWLRPYTDDEIRRAGAEARPVVVVPVAFVSEHSETLVELDLEYRELAAHAGVPRYVRVATVGEHQDYIASLAELARRAMAAPAPAILSEEGMRICAAGARACPHR